MITLLTSITLAVTPSVTIELPMEAWVSGTEIELGEIAEVVGLNPEDVRLVESIELGYAPAPGYSRLLRADRIRGLLERKAPQLQVRLSGQRATRVWPQVEEIPDAELHTVALVALRRTYAKNDATFELAAALPKVVVPAGARSHLLRAKVDETKLVSGNISVPVEVLVDGAVYRTIWTSWKTEVYDTLLVLTRPVKAGEALAPEMFTRQRTRIVGGAKAKPLGPRHLLGAVAARDLAPGEVVTGIDVHRPALIGLGDVIFLCVKKGGIEARVPAVAMSAGAAGDRIRVRTTETGQELTAIIRSRDVAEICLGS
jgi:flagellar basal body P-ring formation protein FlgA